MDDFRFWEIIPPVLQGVGHPQLNSVFYDEAAILHHMKNTRYRARGHEMKNFRYQSIDLEKFFPLGYARKPETPI